MILHGRRLYIVLRGWASCLCFYCAVGCRRRLGLRDGVDDVLGLEEGGLVGWGVL